MPRIEKVLVPLDFSGPSMEALRYAVQLTASDAPAFTLLHVYQIPGYFFPDGMFVAGEELVSSLVQRIEASLGAARVEAEAAGARNVTTVMAQGAPHTEIIEHAQRGDYDLIVMGTHGHTGVRHALMGSVAEKVVRKAPCPVVTVREGSHTFATHGEAAR